MNIIDLMAEAIEQGWSFDRIDKELYPLIKQAQKDQVVGFMLKEELDDLCKQPEQEPVAWMHNHIKGNVIAHRPADIDRHPEHWTALYPEPKPCPTCEALARTVMLDQTSHDTTPPQRTWVGLTLKEILDTYRGPDGSDYVDYARGLEARLKEKNT